MTVDDDVAIQELYETMLTLSGYHISGQAFDGERAVSLFAALNPRPDLIILDHRMPVMTGLEAARAIRALDPSARIIFISADSSVKKDAKEAGSADFLVKPFALSDLKAVLKRALERTPPPSGPGHAMPAVSA